MPWIGQKQLKKKVNKGNGTQKSAKFDVFLNNFVQMGKSKFS